MTKCKCVFSFKKLTSTNIMYCNNVGVTNFVMGRFFACLLVLHYPWFLKCNLGTFWPYAQIRRPKLVNNFHLDLYQPQLCYLLAKHNIILLSASFCLLSTNWILIHLPIRSQRQLPNFMIN